MKIRRAFLPAVALLLTACNDAPWSDGTFVGELTSSVGHLVVTVFNDTGEEDRIRVDVNAVGSCMVSATITVTGNVMRVTPRSVFSPSCYLEDITLMRINDRVARTVYRGAVVEMKKQ